LVVTYLRQKAGFTPELASMGLSTFWLAMLLGRYLNTRLPGVKKDQVVIIFEAFGSSLFLLLLLYFQNPVLSILSLVMVGIFMAGLLPRLLAHASERNPGYASSISCFVQTGVGTGMLVGLVVIGCWLRVLISRSRWVSSLSWFYSLGFIFS
jgi:fucose permease